MRARCCPSSRVAFLSVVCRYAGAHRSNPMNARYDTDVTPRGAPPRLPPYVRRRVEAAIDPFIAAAAPQAGEGQGTPSGGDGGDGVDGGDGGDGGDGDDNGSAATGADTTGAGAGSAEAFDLAVAEALAEVSDESAVAAVLDTCSVVCGLHPDGATEPLVSTLTDPLARNPAPRRIPVGLRATRR